MNVTHTSVADLGEGWTPGGWTLTLACGHVTDGVAHMQFVVGDTMLCGKEHEAPAVAQSSEWFECDRPGCDVVMGSVGDPDPDEPWDDYDPIGEHIAAHERDDARPLEHDVAVQVVAQTLANGAPHPFAGRVGVVLEVRDAGMHPVRVSIGGRSVQFAAGELRRAGALATASCG